jgi:hypothetical protein
MTISTLPPAPLPTDVPADFNSKAFALLGSLATFVTEANATAADADQAKVDAQTAASTATAAGAPKWVSGTTYAQGNLVWSPTNYYTYRRKVAGAGTTDPSSDATNWALISAFGDVTLTTAQTLTNKTLTAPAISAPTISGATDFSGSQRAAIVAVAALSIDCSAGNFFTKTISANSTFTFANAPASRAYSFTLELTHTSGTVTWPAAVVWPFSVAPTLATGKTHLFMFVTDDGGTRWRGAVLQDYTN